jgi:NAD(P)-dependent dehydrogenase (short-subunit alcohol dehydrogenase family)
MQLGTNHLGHFALTGHVLPLLVAAPAPRVVTVSSVAHKGGSIDFDDLQSQRGYKKWGAYSQSKLANLLFTMELDRRAKAARLPLISAASHPGYAATDLQTKGPQMSGNGLMTGLMTLGNALFGQPAAQGAWPSLYAATMPDVEGGDYFGPRGIAEWRGSPKRVKPIKSAYDAETARRLWDVSEQLTKVSYDLTPAR